MEDDETEAGAAVPQTETEVFHNILSRVTWWFYRLIGEMEMTDYHSCLPNMKLHKLKKQEKTHFILAEHFWKWVSMLGHIEINAVISPNISSS